MVQTLMILNQRTLKYEGLHAKDGRFVTVTWDRWRKESRKFHNKDEVSDPMYWIRNSLYYPTEVTVWGADSFSAVEAQTDVDQCLRCVSPLLQVVVRPTPLGYGIRLNYPDGSMLCGHLTGIRTLTQLVRVHSINLAESWERETYVCDIPLPPYRRYSEQFSSDCLPRKGEAEVSEVLFRLLVSSGLDGYAEEDPEALRIKTLQFFCCAVVAPQLVQTFLHGYDFSSQQVQPYRSTLGSRPNEEVLLHLVEIVLVQCVYEDWCGYAPGEEQCENLAHYLYNVLLQIMFPNAFEV